MSMANVCSIWHWIKSTPIKKYLSFSILLAFSNSVDYQESDDTSFMYMIFFLNSQHKTQAGSIHNIYPKCIHIQLSKNHIYFINSKNFIRREYIALLQMRLCHHDYCRVLSKQYNSSIRTKKNCWMSYSSAFLPLTIFCNQLFCLFFCVKNLNFSKFLTFL